uniref:hypothetical protein n=1 Tax=Bordetella hinzii TaxID=103855 RepID=UPI001151C266|nr:hypothetical protein [Bordetella hinzii]
MHSRPLLKNRIAIDASRLSFQVNELVRLLSKLPKRRADKFIRKLLRLMASGSFLQLGDNVGSTAGSTADVVFRPRILGLDELVAAAFRASDLYRSLDVPGHKGSPNVEKGGIGASDSTLRGNHGTQVDHA